MLSPEGVYLTRGKPYYSALQLTIKCPQSVYLAKNKCPLSALTGVRILTVFPRIIAGGVISFFAQKRGRLFERRRLLKGGDYFKYCSLEVVP